MNQSTHTFVQHAHGPFSRTRAVLVCLIGACILLLSGCAHQAKTKSVASGFSGQIVRFEFLVVRSTFKAPGAVRYLTEQGYYSGAFDERFKSLAEEVFRDNGITATVHPVAVLGAAAPTEEMYIVARPYGMNIGTTMSTEWEIQLRQIGRTAPIWSGTHFMLNMDRTGMGNFVLGILNALHEQQLVVLPKGYAVSPGGRKNFIID